MKKPSFDLGAIEKLLESKKDVLDKIDQQRKD